MVGTPTRVRLEAGPPQRPAVRLALLCVAAALLALGVEAVRDERIMRAAVAPALDEALLQSFGGRLDALTGRRSLYDVLREEAGARGGDPFAMVEAATRDLDGADPGLVAVREQDERLRRAARLASFLVAGLGGLLALGVVLVYGARGLRGGPPGLLWRAFNGPEASGAAGSRPGWSPLLAEVLVDVLASRGRRAEDGFVALDLSALAGQAWPGPRAQSEALERELRATLRLLCTEVRAGRPTAVQAGEGVAPGQDGRYRVAPEPDGVTAFAAPLPEEAFGLPLGAGPLAYAVFKAAWARRYGTVPPAGALDYPLPELLSDCGLRFGRLDQLAAFRRLHEALDDLRRHGLLERWSVVEGGRPVPPGWFERANLFAPEPRGRAWRMDRRLLEDKRYSLVFVGVVTTATTAPPAPSLQVPPAGRAVRPVVVERPFVDTGEVTPREQERATEGTPATVVASPVTAPAEPAPGPIEPWGEERLVLEALRSWVEPEPEPEPSAPEAVPSRRPWRWRRRRARGRPERSARPPRTGRGGRRGRRTRRF